MRWRLVEAFCWPRSHTVIIGFAKPKRCMRFRTIVRCRPSRLCNETSRSSTYDEQREIDTARRYVKGSRDAVATAPDVGLIVWPESTYTAGLPWRVVEDGFTLPADSGVTKAEVVAGVKDAQDLFQRRAADIQLALRASSGKESPPQLMVGCSVIRYVDGPVQIFSSVVGINRNGRVANWYGKSHLVILGEYIPFGHWFPWLYSLTPLSPGVVPGDGAATWDIEGAKVMPSVCFDTMVERVTNRHLRKLDASGEHVDVVINVTNDAWFKNSAILSHHRRCTQVLAAAHHVPILIAANGGPTVSIDSSGRVIDALPHQTEGFLIANPRRDSRVTLYQRIGDLPAWVAAFLCMTLMASAVYNRMRRPPDVYRAWSETVPSR
ncbi:MAG: nitrilase-related carbon-nitrogen hydrolase [Pirellulaceae bacterium]